MNGKKAPMRQSLQDPHRLCPYGACTGLGRVCTNVKAALNLAFVCSHPKSQTRSLQRYLACVEVFNGNMV